VTCLLATFGCDTAQGYYLSRPVSAQDLERWLIARKEAAAPCQGETKEAVAP